MMRKVGMLAALVLAGCGVAAASSGATGDGVGGTAGAGGRVGGEPKPTDVSKSGLRLQYLGRTLRGDDGSVYVQQGNFWDSELEVECSPQIASDGVMRCLPTTVGYANSAFSDPACTEPALLVPAPDGCPVEPPAFARLRTSCGWGGIAAVEGEIEELWHSLDGECVSLEMPGYSAYRLGPELPASAFVAFE